MARYESHCPVLGPEDLSILGLAELSGTRHERFHHGLKIGGRAGDHAEDLSRRRLLF